MQLRVFLSFFLLFSLLAQNTQAAPGKTLSITFDDLPWSSLPDQALKDVLAQRWLLLQSLQAVQGPSQGPSVRIFKQGML